ncbi:uncharacterized protein [Parasteatoda tepidariorum]|uniref:uncharacterized protein n=1 Tax=Parasteatoda tepidariorum TaxID=114398 RepID=UPI001C727A5F|nr:uncharacterized protein LOC107450317 [Parasteatoda tepidariorum]
MMSAYTLLALTLIMSVGGLVEAWKRCYEQSDCDRMTECCSKHFMTPEAYCVKRRLLGEMCLDGDLYTTMINGTYDITCPCIVGLECRKPKYYDEYGRLMYQRNPSCVPIGSDQAPLEYYLNGFGGYNDVYDDGRNFGGNPIIVTSDRYGGRPYASNDPMPVSRANAYVYRG